MFLTIRHSLQTHLRLKDIPKEPIKRVKGPHLGVGESEILADSGQERRNDPDEPIIDGMGSHEHDQNSPGLPVLRSHKLFIPFARVNRRRKGP